MSSESIAIQVENLGKCYQIYDKPQDRLKQYIYPRVSRLLGRRPEARYREFWALKDVSFEVRRGETVGIIGRNGSGKSTLLQMICGTLSPTTGSVDTRGRVAALLELGAGFNPDFTGRENALMNGMILGLSRSEVEDRFDRIASFADIGEFIEQPVKHYSSGMFARLAFAVAINVDPEILVVDEALSVGDEPFQRKCFARINQMKDDGATILFVSHAGGTIISLCDRAMLLNRGERLYTGMPKRAVFFSLQIANTASDGLQDVIRSVREADRNDRHPDLDDSDPECSGTPDLNPQANLAQGELGGISRTAASVSIVGEQSHFASAAVSDYGRVADEFLDESLVSRTSQAYAVRGARIVDPGLYNAVGNRVNHVVRGRRYSLRFDAHFQEDCPSVRFYALIRTTEGIDLAGCAHPPLASSGIDVESSRRLVLTFEFDCALNPGTYFCNFAIQAGDGSLHHRIVDALAFRVLPDEHTSSTGIVDLGYRASIEAART